MQNEKWKEIRKVNGAGEIDVVVLYQHRDDKTLFAYAVPVGVNDGTDDIHEAADTERRALRLGMEHLADLAGITLGGYRARMARERRAAAGE